MMDLPVHASQHPNRRHTTGRSAKKIILTGLALGAFAGLLVTTWYEQQQMEDLKQEVLRDLRESQRPPHFDVAPDPPPAYTI